MVTLEIECQDIFLFVDFEPSTPMIWSTPERSEEGTPIEIISVRHRGGEILPLLSEEAFREIERLIERERL